MKTTLDILREARELIRDPSHWTTDAAAARLPNGEKTHAKDPQACCWSAMGALTKAGYLDLEGPNELYIAMHLLYEGAGHTSIRRLNDEQGHAAVLVAFDNAIAEAEKME